MLAGVAIIIALISGPMLLVSKQVYIRNSSMKMEKMNDSLFVLQKEITTLRLRCEQLSSNERIERLAREYSQLDYPTSNQIVVVKLNGDSKNSGLADARHLISFFKKAFGVKG
jgi:cell division protein FtsL